MMLGPVGLDALPRRLPTCRCQGRDLFPMGDTMTLGEFKKVVEAMPEADRQEVLQAIRRAWRQAEQQAEQSRRDPRPEATA